MKIINFGSLNVDYVYRVDRFLLPGETRPAKNRSIYAGGKGLNQSIAIARAGAQVFHAGMTGIDGALLLDALKESNVNTEHMMALDGAGGHTIIQVDDSGQNTILLFGGTNRALTKEYIDGVLHHFSKEDVVLLQNEVNLVEYTIEKAFDLGIRVAFNAAPIDDGVIRYPLEKVSWLIVNEIEGGELAGKSEPDEVLHTLAEKYPKTAILLTLGADGCRYLSGGEELLVPACSVSKIVDTTAAGDTFTGYFLHSITQGAPVKKALEIASAASALAIQKNGAASSIPWANEVECEIKNML